MHARGTVPLTSLLLGYYDGATDLYEYGWGQNFHFARYYPGEAFYQAIARHEPRLRNVRASLELRDDAVNCLNFSITALLVVHAAQEPVNFDAVLQPSSLHYTISKARRLAQGT